MVDIHTHILPRMDDGAKSVEESLLLLKDAYQKGVRILVATPHCHVQTEQDIENFLERREISYRRLEQAMQEEQGEYPRIILGAEVALNAFVHTLSNMRKLCIGETDYMLLEPQIGRITLDTGEWLHSFTVKGVKPIVAHINRYTDQGLDVMSLFSLPVVCQVNAEAFLTFSDRRRMRRLLPELKTIVMGSDMHNTTVRPFTLDKAYKKAKKMFPDKVDMWFHQNGTLILS